jgi:hypothetical protein
MLNVSSGTVKPKNKQRPPSITEREQTQKIKKTAFDTNGPSSFNMINKNAVNHMIKGGDKKPAMKQNIPTTTAVPRQVQNCLPAPAPESTKPVRFTMNGKTPFFSYDWGN